MVDQPENSRVTGAQILDALEENMGNLTMAARDLGMARSALKTRIDNNPELRLALDDLREGVVDVAETNMFKRVYGGADPGAERFVLSTLGKSRGYTQSVAGTGKDGDIVVTIKKFGED